MRDCKCGTSVRLRAKRVRIHGRSGCYNYIEHTDGSRVCNAGDWSCIALKPYPKDKEKREYSKLIQRWEKSN